MRAVVRDWHEAPFDELVKYVEAHMSAAAAGRFSRRATRTERQCWLWTS